MSDLSPLFSVGEATHTMSYVLCPILGLSVQERLGATGENLTKGLKDDKGTEASLL